MAQEQVAGFIANLVGRVFAEKPDGTQRVLAAGDEVFSGETVRTAAGAWAEIFQVDGFVFQMPEQGAYGLIVAMPETQADLPDGVGGLGGEFAEVEGGPYTQAFQQGIHKILERARAKKTRPETR